MDVDSLRTELEKHLARNPDEHAPHGFRDRFNAFAEQYQAEEGEEPRAVIEQELHRVRAEAETAANVVIVASLMTATPELPVDDLGTNRRCSPKEGLAIRLAKRTVIPSTPDVPRVVPAGREIPCLG